MCLNKIKKNGVRFLLSLCVFSFLIITNDVFAEEPKVKFNDKEISFKQKIVVEDGRILVAFKDISELLHGETKWDKNNKRAVIFIDGTYYIFTANSNIMERGNYTIASNGSYSGEKSEKIELSTSSRIVDEYMYIPLADFVKFAGAYYFWEPTSQTLEIKYLLSEHDGFIKVEDYKDKVLHLINIERTAAGLKPLIEKPILNDICKLKVEDMLENDYYAHKSPAYGNINDILKGYDIKWTLAGENLLRGEGGPVKFVESWMNSESHRRNILLPEFQYTGIYMTEVNGVIMCAQVFISE